MNPHLDALSIQLKLHTRLLAKCFDGIDDETARKRPNDGTNSMAFLGVHLVGARRYLATDLGVDEPAPFDGRFENVNDIGDVDPGELPPVEEIVASWEKVGSRLARRLGEVAGAELAAEAKAPFPIDDNTRLGSIAFLLHHEAYHLGQLGYLRKLMGHDSMKYS